MTRCVAFLFGLLLPVLAAADEVPDYAKLKVKWLETCKAQREERIAGIDREAAVAKADLDKVETRLKKMPPPAKPKTTSKKKTPPAPSGGDPFGPGGRTQPAKPKAIADMTADELRTEKARLTSLLKSLEDQHRAALMWAPGLDPLELKAGDFGCFQLFDKGDGGVVRLGRQEAQRPGTMAPPTFTIRRVIDSRNALATWGDRWFWLELDASKIVDDQTVPIADFVHVVGTKRYATVGGGTKTVLHVRVVK